MKEAKFEPAESDCLSPAGEYNLRLGVIKEIGPEFVATCKAEPSAHEGHPFIIEAAISYGGKSKQGFTIYRFANRIPLLFESGSDVVSQVAQKQIKWAGYKIKNTDKIGIFVSIVSTKIPFKGTSKEYIGDDKGPLNEAIKVALSACCSQLRKHIVKKAQEKERGERKKTLVRYIPDVTRAVMAVLSTMADHKTGAVALGPAPKKPRLAERMQPELKTVSVGILNDVSAGKIKETTLKERLEKHVEEIDSELALEYMASLGRGSEDDIYIPGLPSALKEPIFHKNFTFSLFA
jgi:DNA topoisomerase VI subunit B